jgi:alkylation response protein AidB-like acyl-CoA dehydrogenase
MGIQASPTCVLAYGDNSDGAIGYLIGEENAGMRYMFTMMNNARLGVGVEGLGLAERATSRRWPTRRSASRAGRPARPRREVVRSSSTPTCAACCSR